MVRGRGATAPISADEKSWRRPALAVVVAVAAEATPHFASAPAIASAPNEVSAGNVLCGGGSAVLPDPPASVGEGPRKGQMQDRRGQDDICSRVWRLGQLPHKQSRAADHLPLQEPSAALALGKSASLAGGKCHRIPRRRDPPKESANVSPPTYGHLSSLVAPPRREE